MTSFKLPLLLIFLSVNTRHYQQQTQAVRTAGRRTALLLPINTAPAPSPTLPHFVWVRHFPRTGTVLAGLILPPTVFFLCKRNKRNDLPHSAPSESGSAPHTARADAITPWQGRTGCFVNGFTAHWQHDKPEMEVNPLTLNDHYSGRTAPLTSKRCILYIYSTNKGTEYFKHGIYCPIFLFKMQFVS